MRTVKKTRIVDNTMISDHRTCDRYFYYRHVRGFNPESKSPALSFGSAWHEAMDIVWKILSKNKDAETSKVAELAYRSWEDNWTSDGLPGLNEMSGEMDDRFKMRNPSTALEMIYSYIEKRRHFISQCELIAIEQPFAVPLDPSDKSLVYVGRLDKVVKHEGEIKIIEHKTSSEYSAGGGFRRSFADSFSPNSQIDGYLFAGRMLYGKKCTSILVDAALVHRDHHDTFAFFPIRRQEGHIDAWLWETRVRIDQIEANLAALKSAAPKGQYMAAFPKNTSSCTKYNGCQYLDLCKMWANPISKDIPAGFKYEIWEPFDLLKLSKINLKKSTVVRIAA